MNREGGGKERERERERERKRENEMSREKERCRESEMGNKAREKTGERETEKKTERERETGRKQAQLDVIDHFRHTALRGGIIGAGGPVRDGEGREGGRRCAYAGLCELRLIYLNHVAAQEGFYVLISRT